VRLLISAVSQYTTIAFRSFSAAFWPLGSPWWAFALVFRRRDRRVVVLLRENPASRSAGRKLGVISDRCAFCPLSLKLFTILDLLFLHAPNATDYGMDD